MDDLGKEKGVTVQIGTAGISKEVAPSERGVTDKVFTDLLLRRESMCEATLNSLTQINPELAKFMIRQCFTSPDPQLSLQWVVAYFKVLEETNTDIPRVSSETINSLIRRDARDRNPTPIDMMVPQAFRKSRIDPSRVKKRMEEDGERNSDLQQFWSAVMSASTKFDPTTGGAIIAPLEWMCIAIDEEVHPEPERK